MILPLTVKDKSIETSGITKNYKEALCEFIWNSFEANATEVTIASKKNSLSLMKSKANKGKGRFSTDFSDNQS